jgi:hypothetical protein
MLKFSDDQLTQIFRCAAPLAPGLRSDFLRDVAAELDGKELGDGLVLRTCREVQRRYWTPPVDTGNAGVEKYR